MNAKVLRVLEYDKVIRMLEDKASSAPGRELCRSLTPMTDLTDIEAAQEETAAALARLFSRGSINFGNNRPLGMSLKSLEIGSALSAPELLGIAGLLENAARAKNYGRQQKEDEATDCLTEDFNFLEPLTPLSTEIRRCILSEEEIADDASANLKRIRRSMVTVGERIHSQLNGMVNGSARSWLQDSVITMRDGRYCIPVKSEYKNQVPGMVHDQSSSGSTFFIEPAAVVNLNNQLRELEIEEQKEIAVILAGLSAQAAEHATEISENMRILTRLDFIFARAGLAMDLNATRPVFNPDHQIRIRQGRHPLLDKKKVVPIDVELGRDFDLLIITGPNTGGKTVSLKTVGLLTLMGQSGLHIPALDRSELSVFTEVFADIGDEQSIEQSLSTFSSHMTSIVSILAHADADSLCLFDELGAGTDPTEGAALAIAILNFLHDRGIRTMATTHYSELKIYALSTPFVENACCEFDVETLRPTYRLLLGIPGKSNAFAISRKLGLSDEIIEAAKEQIDEQDVNFEDVISDLEASRVTIEREQREIEAYKKEVETLKKRLQEKNEKIDQAKDRILREANEKAREILQDAKNVADESIRVFQKAGPGASMKDLEKTREKLRGKIDEKNSRLSIQNREKEAPKAQLKPEQLKKGDLVKVVSMGLKGTVSSLPDAKGNLFVQCGILRTNVNIRDLVRMEEPSVTAPNMKRTGAGKLRMSKSISISPEINLLGKTVDEAIPLLDKYLDDAYLAHLKSVRVVHGKGTGALRNAVQQHLKRVKYIRSYRLGEYGEGDAGVTIVEFKE
ncbi:MAG TPA: endonuclease MutS2 [Candidatus Eisenbergiella merdigallinarum]|uniref:Endonuclease MutS2 n=1 Tax=Candidatus Eisenbergiella merdigallinarum TaxID=2838552 RepID=A0A9D2MR53_9FIRM|nr:endonuclease MutS2 [Candidatus Eisenbergiella merdigallinarum]